MANPGISWAFNYEGPISALDDRSCDLCNAASTGKCPKTLERHGGTPEHCSSCQAARHGYCHLHGGVEKVLEEHPRIHNLEGKNSLETYNEASSAIRDFVARVGNNDASVRIKATFDSEHEDWGLLAQLKIQIDILK